MSNSYLVDMTIHVTKTLHSPENIEGDLTERIKEEFPKLLVGTCFSSMDPKTHEMVGLMDTIDFPVVNVTRLEEEEEKTDEKK